MGEILFNAGAFILQRQKLDTPGNYEYFMAAVAQSPEIGKTKKKSKNVVEPPIAEPDIDPAPESEEESDG